MNGRDAQDEPRAKLWREIEELRVENDRIRASLQNECEGLHDRVRALETALSDAIDRLNGFLSAYEGAPEPSENDTKQLVVRLATVLQTTEDT